MSEHDQLQTPVKTSVFVETDGPPPGNTGSPQSSSNPESQPSTGYLARGKVCQVATMSGSSHTLYLYTRFADLLCQP